MDRERLSEHEQRVADRADSDLLTHAEAYRLVEELHLERQRADRAEAALAEMRAAIVSNAWTGGEYQCALCLSYAAAREQIEHVQGCLMLATDPDTRGAAILEAAERLCAAVEPSLFALPSGDASDIQGAIDAWRALTATELEPAP